MRPEHLVLLSAARADDEAPAGARLADALAAVTDWDHLRREAIRHGMAPILYSRLGEADAEHVPPGFLADLQGLYLANSRRSLVAVAELVKIVRRLRSAGILAVPFKGPALSQSAYGDPGLRGFSDLDILVGRADLAGAVEALRDLGYLPPTPFTPLQHATHLDSGVACTLRGPPGTTTLEIHWAIVPVRLARRLDPALMLARAEPLHIAGADVPALSPGDTFLALCAHGAKHYWGDLESIHCLAALIRRHPAADWARVMARATRAGLRRRCLCGLLLAGDICAATIPRGLLEEAQSDRAVARAAGRARDLLFADTREGPRRTRRPLRRAYMFDTRRDAVRYALDQVFSPTPADVVGLPLPAGLYLFARALRPVRYGRSLLPRTSRPRE